MRQNGMQPSDAAAIAEIQALAAAEKARIARVIEHGVARTAERDRRYAN